MQLLDFQLKWSWKELTATWLIFRWQIMDLRSLCQMMTKTLFVLPPTISVSVR